MGAAAYGWKDIEYPSPTERSARRLIADDQSIPIGRAKRMVTDQLHQPLVSRGNCATGQHGHARR